MPAKELQKGDKAPNFCLPDQNGKKICLDDYKEKWVVLYFYPKDDTSGCTMEANDFSGAIKDFEKLHAVILGVSPDSTNSHQKFCSKYDLKITLLSDPEHIVLEKYGVWQIKKMYGKEYYGVVRSTFVNNPDGKIEHVWRKVKVEGHVEEVKGVIKC